MDLDKYNLRQLLELALRFPEIGAVNFNIVYLILKTIIKNQGIECLTPKLTFVYESPSDSTKEKIISRKEPSNETDEEQEKEGKMGEMEEEIRKLNETVEQLTNRIFELETRQTWKEQKIREPVSDEDQEVSSEEKKEIISKTEDPAVREAVKELIDNVSKDKKPDLPREQEDKKVPKSDKDLAPGTFSWHADREFKDKLLEIKKEVESLKETDQKEVWSEMQILQASNEFVVKKFDELIQDFDTVMNAYSKLGMEVEELNKVVNKKITIEDDVEKLKEKLDKLDTYVYSGQQKSGETEGTKLDNAELLSEEEEEDKQFVRGTVEKPAKQDRKAFFTRMVKNLMAMPEEKRTEIKQGPIQQEAVKVKPMTMKKAYEKFIQAAHKTRVAEDTAGTEVELKETEQAGKIDLAQLQDPAEILSSEVITQAEVADIRDTVQQKLHTTAKAIMLLQDMQKTQQDTRLHKAREMEKFRKLRHRDDGEDEEQQLSVESLEIPTPPPQQPSVEKLKSDPVKATLLFGDDKASQELKERIVMYVKSRLEETETQFYDKMHLLETSIIEVQNVNEALREELLVLKSRLAVVETNQNKLEGRLTVVDDKANLNHLHIEEMMIAIDKKADRFDVMQGMSKRDMSMLEDRMLKISETTISDVEELRSFLKDYTVSLRDELDEKVSGFEMDCRLEPLAGRLKKLEQMLKDVSLKTRVLECQTMGPIEVKRYAHCEDGRRIKPLRRPISNWTSASQSKMSIYGDKFFDGDTAEKLEADIRKRLEEAVFRDSKHLIGGAHTKTKVARSN